MIECAASVRDRIMGRALKAKPSEKQNDGPSVEELNQKIKDLTYELKINKKPETGQFFVRSIIDSDQCTYQENKWFDNITTAKKHLKRMRKREDVQISNIFHHSGKLWAVIQ